MNGKNSNSNFLMEENNSGTPLVLIVDDMPKNLQILGNYLRKEGYKVEFAIDGESALDWIKRVDFDLVLLDVMMPGIDGFEVCRTIKRDPIKQKIPVIFLTAKVDTESILNGFELGAVDYVFKPFNKKELIARVRTQIELKKGRDAIANNLKEIGHKNKLITYSIQYAQTIQTALMKAFQNASGLFADQFFLFLPRDIVSGDFYWIYKMNSKILVGVFDCTGHGIPGAFMSILGVTLLKETVLSEKITEPPLILNRLREKIINALGQEGNFQEVRDGMDGTIISYDPENMKIVFAGAYNPIYIISKNEIHEFTGDKMPLSFYPKMANFSGTDIDVRKGDIIYMFTDGYADQFGGDNEIKKFRRRRFRELLFEIHGEPLNIQQQILSDTFNTWKGKEEQVDDIIVIGLEL